jgi:hypothetical protein
MFRSGSSPSAKRDASEPVSLASQGVAKSCGLLLLAQISAALRASGVHLPGAQMSLVNPFSRSRRGTRLIRQRDGRIHQQRVTRGAPS